MGGEARSGPVRGVRRWRIVAADSIGTPVVVRIRPPRSSGPRAADPSRRPIAPPDGDPSLRTTTAPERTEAASRRESRGTHPRCATSQNRARRRDGRCGARVVARRVFETCRAPGALFTGPVAASKYQNIKWRAMTWRLAPITCTSSEPLLWLSALAEKKNRSRKRRGARRSPAVPRFALHVTLHVTSRHFTSCAVYRAHWSTPQTLCTNSSLPLSAR